MSGIDLDRKKSKPACGSCGYPTRGMSSFECPECGADIREAGVKVPGLNDLHGIPLYFGLFWSIGMLVFALYVAEQLPTIIPNQQRYQYAANLTPRTNTLFSINATYEEVLRKPGLRGSGASESVGVFSNSEIELSRNHGDADLRWLVFGLSGQAASSGLHSGQPMTIDVQAMKFSHNDSSGKRISGSGTPTQADFAAWLVGCGLSPSDAQTNAIASDLLLYTQALLANRSQVTLTVLKSNGYRVSYSTQREQLWRVGLFVACFLIWLTGLIRLRANPNKIRKNIEDRP